MGEHRALGERLVAAAKPRFKDFRIDFEKISNAAVRSMESGDITKDEARAMFLDADWDIRIPLQRRYAETGNFDAVAHYHAKQFKLLLGRNQPWPDESGKAVLGLFADHGRADIGVALIRNYIDMQHKRLKRDYPKRNPRSPASNLDDNVKNVIGAINRVMANAIPDRKRELLADMETVETYVDEHGSQDDKDWFEEVRREIWMERRA